MCVCVGGGGGVGGIHPLKLARTTDTSPPTNTIQRMTSPPHTENDITHLPVVVRVIIADAFCWKEASTAAMAMVVTVWEGVGVRRLSSLNITV